MQKSIYNIIIYLVLITFAAQAQNHEANNIELENNKYNKIYDFNQGNWIYGGTIQGRVTISKDQPISDVCVSVYDDKNWNNSRGKTRTDKLGNYTINKLQTGMYYIYIDASCEVANNFVNLWWADKTGTNDSNKAVPIKIVAGQTLNNINFSLNQGGIIFGKITSTDGQPIQDICVAATSPCKKYWYGGNQTDKEGNYYIYGLASGNYYIHTDTYCGDNPRQYKEKWWDRLSGTIDCQLADFVSIIEGQTIQGINISLGETPQISGRIVNNFGQGITDVCVNAMEKCGIISFGKAISDKNGYFNINDIKEGSFYIHTNASCMSPKNYVNHWWDGSIGNIQCKNASPVIISKDHKTYKNIELKLQKGGIIKGRISTNDDIPLANVCIGATENKCSKLSYLEYTDENGDYFFVVPPGNYFISSSNSNDAYGNYIDKWYGDGKSTIDCNNAMPISVKEESKVSNIDLSLEQGGYISGTIKTKDNQPFEGICVMALNKKCSDKYIIKKVTDKHGNFLMKLPAGKYFINTDVNCQSNKYYINAWWNNDIGAIDCSNASEIILEKDKNVTNINIQIQKAGLISGNVKSVRGNPLSNVIVYATKKICNVSKSFVSQTNIDGNYQIPVHDNQYYIYAEITMNKDSNYYISKWWNSSMGTLNCKMAELINVHSGKKIDSINFTIEKGGTISGRVLTISGDPLNDICINLENETKDIVLGKVKSDITGRYKISGVPEGMIYAFIDASCGIQRNYIDKWASKGIIEHHIDIIQGKDLFNINFNLEEGGSISGHITSNTKHPVTGICVNATNLCGEEFFSIGITNNKGYYLIPGIPEGQYYVRTNNSCNNLENQYFDKWWNIDKGTLDCKEADPVTVKIGYTTEYVDIIITQDIAISGHVTTMNGVPIPEVCVNLTTKCEEKWVSAGETNSEGYFAISGIEAGDYYIRTNASCINKQSYLDKWWDNNSGTYDCESAARVTIIPGQTQQGFNFQLEQAKQEKQISDDNIVKNIQLKDGYYQENVDGGIVTFNITKGRVDLIVKNVSLEKVLKIISKRTGLRIILHGLLEEKISFERRNEKLDLVILDLIQKRAGYIFIYSPKNSLSKIIIFSKQGEVSIYRDENEQSNTSPPGIMQEQIISRELQEQELWKLLKGTKNVEKKIHALTGIIGRFDDEKSIELLSSALNDQDEDVRMTSIAVMYDLKNNQLAVPVIARSLNGDSSPAVRALSAEALGEIGDKRSIRALTDALNDSDAGVRETARNALEKINGPTKKN